MRGIIQLRAVVHPKTGAYMDTQDIYLIGRYHKDAQFPFSFLFFARFAYFFN